MPERKIADVQQEWLLKSMAVNAVGPLLVTQAFSPMMDGKRDGRGDTLVCNLSARVGSIGDNRLGGMDQLSDVQGGVKHVDEKLFH